MTPSVPELHQNAPRHAKARSDRVTGQSAFAPIIFRKAA